MYAEIIRRLEGDGNSVSFDEALAALDDLGRRRLERGAYLASYLFPQLAGSGDKREQTIILIFEYMAAEYNDGIRDAADVVRRLREGLPHHERVLGAVENSLNKLYTSHLISGGHFGSASD